MMKTFLLATCAAALLMSAVQTASATDARLFDGVRTGTIIRVGDNDNNYRYGNPYGWPYQMPGYHSYGNGWDNDDNDNGWRPGWGQGDYNRHNVLPPRVIVRYLDRRNYSYISRPVLDGRYYQVKAINPHGRKVKLYIDPYTGRIVKSKYRG